jgi:hypothetical protein
MDAIVCPADSYVGENVCRELQVRLSAFDGLYWTFFLIASQSQDLTGEGSALTSTPISQKQALVTLVIRKWQM